MFDIFGGGDKAEEERRRKQREDDDKKRKADREMRANRYWKEKKEKKLKKRLKLNKEKKQKAMREMLDKEFEAVMDRRQKQKEQQQGNGPKLSRGHGNGMLSQEIPGSSSGNGQKEQMGLRGASKLPNYQHETIEDRCGFNQGSSAPGGNQAAFTSKLKRF